MLAFRFMLTEPTQGILIKIDRAKAHLDDLEAQVRLIDAACQKAIIRERDEQRAEHIFRLAHVPAISSNLCAIIGDAVHNLRASLDHLVWHVVKTTGGTPRVGPRGTSFPILDQPGRPFSGISKELWGLLDEVQPYKRPKPPNHELAVLHKLDIIDKHRELLVAVIGIRGGGLGWWGGADVSAFNSGPYGDGDELFRFIHSDTQSGYEVQPIVRFTVCLNEPAAGPLRHSLGAAQLIRHSLAYIEREVLPRFQRFL
jgi:hypothetical protein